MQKRSIMSCTSAAAVLATVLAVSVVSPVEASPGIATVSDAVAAAPLSSESVANSGQVDDIVDASDPGGRQTKLTDFKAWLLAQPGIGESGYIESVNDAAAGATTLLWHGSSPLQQAAINHGAGVGVTVRIHQRKYDRRALEAAARDIVENTDRIPGFRVAQAIAVSADFDGVVVEGESVGPQPAAARTMSSPRIGPLNSALAVPVKLVPGKPVQPIAATRVNDTAPYNAGGFMKDPQTSGPAQVCSTGFAIKQRGITFTTTARHCYYHHYKAYRGNGQYGDGVVNSGDGAGRTLNSRGSKLMFDGAYNNPDGYKKTVIGYGSVSLDDSVCVSGGNTGAHCGVKIDSVGMMWNDGFGTVSTIGATRAGQVGVAAPGDSGGPVFITAGAGKVRAVGMIQWGSIQEGSPYRVFCETNTGHRICSTRVGFTLMSVIVNSIPNASLVTD